MSQLLPHINCAVAPLHRVGPNHVCFPTFPTNIRCGLTLACAELLLDRRIDRIANAGREVQCEHPHCRLSCPILGRASAAPQWQVSQKRM